MDLPASTPRARLLVVDDEPAFLLLARHSLGALHDLVCESEPARALARLIDEPFDLVLTDQRMPGMSGLELMRQARAIRPGLPFVILTVSEEADLQTLLLREGAVACLSKPVTPEGIAPFIRKPASSG